MNNMKINNRSVILVDHVEDKLSNHFRENKMKPGDPIPNENELAVHAEKCGANAIAMLSPSFFKQGTVKELVSFLAPIAASEPRTSFYFYYFPS